MEALHLLLPTSFWTSQAYSPLSSFSANGIFKLVTLFVMLSLYFLPVINSVPFLNHLALISGVPVKVQSSVAGSPAVTLIESAFSIILAGSVTIKKSY